MIMRSVSMPVFTRNVGIIYGVMIPRLLYCTSGAICWQALKTSRSVSLLQSSESCTTLHAANSQILPPLANLNLFSFLPARSPISPFLIQ
jgi:hypothetical protein